MGNGVDHGNEPICAQVGHIITTITVVRCLHHEAVTLHAWTVVNDSDDDLDPLLQRTIHFGPFDDSGDIRDTVAHVTHEHVTQNTRYIP